MFQPRMSKRLWARSLFALTSLAPRRIACRNQPNDLRGLLPLSQILVDQQQLLPGGSAHRVHREERPRLHVGARRALETADLGESGKSNSLPNEPRDPA